LHISAVVLDTCLVFLMYYRKNIIGRRLRCRRSYGAPISGTQQLMKAQKLKVRHPIPPSIWTDF
jgi:hypothetical protein